jgi:hypothetical protein
LPPRQSRHRGKKNGCANLRARNHSLRKSKIPSLVPSCFGHCQSERRKARARSGLLLTACDPVKNLTPTIQIFMPQPNSPEALANDRLLSMRQIADRWGLKTTVAALERITKASIPIVRLNGKSCSAYLSEILALERKATHQEMPPTKRRAP